MLSQKEKGILRNLAAQYMEVAALPIQSENIRLWKCLNAGQMERPMVAIDQLPWHEFDSHSDLRLSVQDPVWQSIERFMRQKLFQWKYFPGDMVIEPIIPIPMAITGQGYGIEIKEEVAVTDVRNEVTSHRYENQFIDEKDVAKIRNMHIQHDESETARRMEQANELFHDVAKVRLKGLEFHVGLWDFIAQLMGVEQIYYDLIEQPEFLHQIMRRFTDATLAGIRQANELQVNDGNGNQCHCSYIYTEELLPAPGTAKGQTARDTWAYGMAQLFTSVSPEVTQEFELPYIKEIAEHFGGFYYGCCERLEDRLDVLFQIPNLRKISCSPWSNPDIFAEKVGQKYVMSVKPNPAILATKTVDYSLVREDIQKTLKAALSHGCNVEFILKDISTVHYEPERLTKWNEIIYEEVEQQN
jgi:hypothetical protein